MFRRTETTAAAMTSPKQVVSKAIFRVCLSQQLNDANPLFRCHRCPWKDLPDIGLCNQPVFYRSEQLLTDWYRLTLLIQIYPFFFLSLPRRRRSWRASAPNSSLSSRRQPSISSFSFRKRILRSLPCSSNVCPSPVCSSSSWCTAWAWETSQSFFFYIPNKLLTLGVMEGGLFSL